MSFLVTGWLCSMFSSFSSSNQWANQNRIFSWWWLNCKRWCPAAQVHLKPFGHSKSHGQAQSQGARKYTPSMEVEGKGRYTPESKLIFPFIKSPWCLFSAFFTHKRPQALFTKPPPYCPFNPKVLKNSSASNDDSSHNELLPLLQEQGFRKTYTHFS